MITRNVPKSLQADGLFCVWKYIVRDGKKTKCPFDPLTGKPCASNNPLTFGSFAQAKFAMERGGYDGMGVGIFGNVCAIDIDHCIDASGKLSDKAKDIISEMHSYTELSPSGKGIHILFRADDFEYDKAKYYINNQAEGVEVYIAGATNKFVTITGKSIIGTPHDLQERSGELSAVLNRHMLRKGWEKRNHSVHFDVTLNLSDEEILRLVVAHNERFGPLLNGDISEYGFDQSRADMALCSKLAFYTRDPDQIDRIYRNSGLCRKDGKWDRKQCGSTYGRLTIEKALNLVVDLYGSRSASKAAPSEEHESLTDKINRAQKQSSGASDSRTADKALSKKILVPER